MQYKQYNGAKTCGRQPPPPNTSKYKVLHIQYMLKTCKYIPIRGGWRPQVFAPSWVYWDYIGLYLHVFFLYCQNKYVLIQSIHANTIVSVLKAYFQPNILYLYV